MPAGILVPAFPQRSPPRHLIAAACGGLRSSGTKDLPSSLVRCDPPVLMAVLVSHDQLLDSPGPQIDRALQLTGVGGSHGRGDPPKSAKRAFIRGSASAELISVLSFWIISAGVFLGAPMPYPRACLVTWHEFTQCAGIRQDEPKHVTSRRRPLPDRSGRSASPELISVLSFWIISAGRERPAGQGRGRTNTQPWVRSCVERMVGRSPPNSLSSRSTSSFTLFSAIWLRAKSATSSPRGGWMQELQKV